MRCKNPNVSIQFLRCIQKSLIYSGLHHSELHKSLWNMDPLSWYYLSIIWGSRIQAFVPSFLTHCASFLPTVKFILMLNTRWPVATNRLELFYRHRSCSGDLEERTTKSDNFEKGSSTMVPPLYSPPRPHYTSTIRPIHPSPPQLPSASSPPPYCGCSNMTSATNHCFRLIKRVPLAAFRPLPPGRARLYYRLCRSCLSKRLCVCSFLLMPGITSPTDTTNSACGRSGFDPLRRPASCTTRLCGFGCR